jgi:hypothetical protein
MSIRQERRWASFCHLAAFAAFLIPVAGLVIGPLVMWLLGREKSSFVHEEGMKAVNFQISVFVYLLLGLVLTRVYIGYLWLFVVFCLDLVCVVAASIKANNSEDFRYPVSIQFVK